MPTAAGLYYFVNQEGYFNTPPVVLIHGAGGGYLYWPAEVRRMAGFRIYAVDLPGHGKSEGRGHQSIPAYVRSLIDWMIAVELNRAVFIGHSMGSAIALTLAVQNPEQVLGLGLVGAGARMRVNPEIISHSSSLTTFHKAVNSLVTSGFSREADQRAMELAEKRMLETRHSVLHGDLLACDTFDLIEEIVRIQKPTLVLSGSEDSLIPIRYSQFLAGGIGGAKIEVIPGAGHMVMLEKPKETAAILSNFLSTISF
jgi:pimeloyl-ACP methyl ester carboxylesterase